MEIRAHTGRVRGMSFKRSARLELEGRRAALAVTATGSAGWKIKLTTKERIIAADMMGWRRDGDRKEGRKEKARKGKEGRIMRMAGLDDDDDDNRSTSQEDRVGRYG